MKILLNIILVFTAISAMTLKEAHLSNACAPVILCTCNNPGEGNQNALNGM